MCQMFWMALSVLSSSIVNQMSLIICFYFIICCRYLLLCLLHVWGMSTIPFAPNPMVKINDVGKKSEMIRMVNKKLHHTRLRCWIFLSTWSNVFWPMRFFSLLLFYSPSSHYFVVYAARQLFYFLCVFLYSIDNATTSHICMAVPTKMFIQVNLPNGKTCCCRLLHDGRSLLLLLLHVWFLYLCMRVIERASCFMRILHLLYPKKCMCT